MGDGERDEVGEIVEEEVGLLLLVAVLLDGKDFEEE